MSKNENSKKVLEKNKKTQFYIINSKSNLKKFVEHLQKCSVILERFSFVFVRILSFWC